MADTQVNELSTRIISTLTKMHPSLILKSRLGLDLPDASQAVIWAYTFPDQVHISESDKWYDLGLALILARACINRGISTSDLVPVEYYPSASRILADELMAAIRNMDANRDLWIAVCNEVESRCEFETPSC